MNCDRIARCYLTFEYLAFGRALNRRRLAFLDEMSAAHSVLILGDGDGRFTAEFVKRNPRAQVESIDSSTRMIEIAKRRAGDYAANVNFRVGDARTMPLQGKYDLVVTHFFLDCFTDEELETLAVRVAEHCEPAAAWVISEFGLPESGLARVAARLLIRCLYFCFRLATGLKVNRLSDYGSLLTRLGFSLAERRTAFRGLLVSEMRRSSLFTPPVTQSVADIGPVLPGSSID